MTDELSDPQEQRQYPQQAESTLILTRIAKYVTTFNYVTAHKILANMLDY